MAVEIHITGDTIYSVIADMRMLCMGDIKALGEPIAERRVGCMPELAAPYGGGQVETTEPQHTHGATEAAQTAAESTKRTRRTKEQIAADNAAAEAAKAAANAPAPAIAYDTAQDEADEQAETEAARAQREPEKKLTHDDCRNVMGGYAKKFGMAAAQEDLSKVWQGAGVQANKVSEIAEADLPKAHAALLAAVENNPFDRKAV